MSINRRNIYLRYFYNFSETGFFFDIALLKELKVALSGMNEPAILDYGCGPKPWKALFSQYSGYIGCDVYPGAEVDIVFDGKSIPLAEESMCLVFSSSVLEHVEKLQTTLFEINRILKSGGTFLSVVPFHNQIHGSPFDFQRPTYYGWRNQLIEAFGEESKIEIVPLSNSLCCLLNLTTSAINYFIYDFLRYLKNNFSGSAVPAQKTDIQSKNDSKALEKGDASPEGAGNAMRWLYRIMALNPVNFLLEIVSLVLFVFPPSSRTEGQLTSGYLLKVIKK